MLRAFQSRQVLLIAAAGSAAAYFLAVSCIHVLNRANSSTATVLPSASMQAGFAQRAAAGRQMSPLLSQPPVPPHMIVTARHTEDVQWMLLRLGDIPATVYQFVQNITEHEERCVRASSIERPGDCPVHALQPGGREPAPYLQFIIDNYDHLPAVMLMIHPHENSWHRDNFVNLFHRLKWGSFEFANIRHWGYTNWMCGTATQDPCDTARTLMLTPSNPEASRDQMLNEAIPAQNWAVLQSQALSDWWGRLFQDELGQMPAQVMEPACCAEFLVTRERVLRRPLAFYQNALKVIQEAPDDGARHRVGMAFEGMWHVIFGEPLISQAVYKCDLYECSDEEAADPVLVPPPVLRPYVVYRLRNQSDVVT